MVQHRDLEGKVLPFIESDDGQTSTSVQDKHLLTEFKGREMVYPGSTEAVALLLRASQGRYVPRGADAEFDPLIRVPSAPAKSTESENCATVADAASLQGFQGGTPSGTDSGSNPLARVPSAAAAPANSNDLERRSVWQKLEMILGWIPTKDKDHDVELRDEIHFIVNVNRNDSGRYMINLVTDLVEFGAKVSCTGTGCPSDCRAKNPIVIKQFTIEVIPLLVYPCYRMWVEPHKDSETFTVQNTRSLNVQLGHPRQTALNIDVGESISRTVEAHEWDYIKSASGNGSVFLIWDQNRDKKGKKIEVDKLKVGPIPPLAIPNDLIHMPPGCVLGKGFWKCDSKENLQKVVFYTKVSLHPLLQEKKYIFGYKNSVLSPCQGYEILEC